MEITASAVHDLRSFKALYRLMLCGRHDPKGRLTLFLTVYGILYAIIIAELIILGGSTLLYVVLGVSAAFILLYCYMYFLLPRIKYKAAGSPKDMRNSYVFMEDELRVNTFKGEEQLQKDTLKYPELFKVMESSEYFFIFMSRQSVYLVDKSTIHNGTREDIMGALAALPKGKYIACRY